MGMLQHTAIRSIHAAFLSVILGSVTLTACNQSPPPSPPASKPSVSTPGSSLPDEPWVNFTTGANIKAMALEGDILWLGLSNGMIRYDTRTIDAHEVFTPASTNGGLMSKGIYTVKVDGQGNKWIGTYGGGMTRYDGNSWKTYTVADGLGDQWVYDIVFDRGLMWIATWKGVSVYDGKTFKNYTEKDGLIDKWVYSIALDHDHIWWFGTESGINRFDGKTWSSYTHKDGLGSTVDPPAAASKKTESAAAMAPSTGEEDYGALGNPSMKHHADPKKKNIGANPNFVIASVVDRNNAKWFGTWGAGLSRFDGKTWTTFTNKDGLGGNFIHSLIMDSDGRIWAGTNGGASWYDGRVWRNFSKDDGLVDNNVFSIVFSANGDRWFGTWQGLSRHRGRLPS
ncbi:MAG TPA: two-component regulator propeller domain-containing protein [Nitrospiria bacterium]